MTYNDSFQDRMEEATARLYRSLLPRLEKLVDKERMDRIILVGLPPAVSAVQELMSKSLKERVPGTLSPPSNPDAPAHEWQPLVQQFLASLGFAVTPRSGTTSVPPPAPRRTQRQPEEERAQ